MTELQQMKMMMPNGEEIPLPEWMQKRLTNNARIRVTRSGLDGKLRWYINDAEQFEHIAP